MKRPQITEARLIADRLGAESVVIFAFGGGQVAGASYGATKSKCEATGFWMDNIIDSMSDGAIDQPSLDLD